MKPPKGKHIFGVVKIGEKGQIVIPKEARKVFNIKSGDSLLVLGDEKRGIAIVKLDMLSGMMTKIIDGVDFGDGAANDDNMEE